MRWVGYKPNTCLLVNGANGARVSGPGKAWSRRAVCWLGLALLLFSIQAAAQNRGQFIVRARPGTIYALSNRHGLIIVDRIEDAGLYLVESFDNSPQANARKKKQLEADADVFRVELNAAAILPETTSDSLLDQSTVAVLNSLADTTTTDFYGTEVKASYVDQPPTQLISLQDALAIAVGRGVTVAIIDTGVDPEHPVLKPWLVPGFNFINDTTNVSEFQDLDQSTVSVLNEYDDSTLDQSTVAVLNQSTVAVLNQSTVAVLNDLDLPPAFGHGTMVAGLVHLVAPNAMVMPLKAFSADGTATLFDIIEAVYYAASNGARVLNMSFSLTQESKELHRAISYAENLGVVCVASVGNDGSRTTVYPAAWGEVAGIAATTFEDVRAEFSNYGTHLTLLGAPGTGVITTYPGGTYAAVWGTSFSAPFVGGAAAGVVQIEPAAKAHVIRDAVEVFADSVGDNTVRERLNLYELYLNLQIVDPNGTGKGKKRR